MSEYQERIDVMYTNYRGETRRRRVVPIRIYLGSNEWHPENQWLMDVYDVGKAERRTFALKDCDFVRGNSPVCVRCGGEYGAGGHGPGWCPDRSKNVDE